MRIIYPKRLRYPHGAANHVQATAMACAMGHLIPTRIYPCLAPGTAPSVAAHIETVYHFSVPDRLHIHTIPFYGASAYNLALDVCSGRDMLGKRSVVYTREESRALFALRVGVLRRRRIPLFHEVHDFKNEKALRQIFAKAMGIVFIHEQLRKEAKQRFGYTGPYCIAQSGFAPELFAAAYTAAIKDKAHTDLVYVGTIREDKGVAELLRMLRLLPLSFRLTLVGEPAFRDPALFARLWEEIPDSAGRLRVTGFLPHHAVAGELGRAHMTLLPAVTGQRFYSQIKVFEALGAGVPLVVTPLAHLRQFLEHGKTAFFSQGSSAEDLTAAVLSLAANPDLLQTISENARTLSYKYTWEARAKKLVSFMLEHAEKK